MEKYSLKIDDFWKLNSNKVIHCKNADESELLLTVFKRMENVKKLMEQKVGYSYFRYNLNDKKAEQERCFDNLEHDFDLEFYKSHAGYEIYELKDVDLSAYLTPEEAKIIGDYFALETGNMELGNY